MKKLEEMRHHELLAVQVCSPLRQNRAATRFELQGLDGPSRVSRCPRRHGIGSGETDAEPAWIFRQEDLDPPDP